MSTRDYERLIGRMSRFSAAWDAFRAEVDVAALGIEPEEIFADVRSGEPGRDPDFER